MAENNRKKEESGVERMMEAGYRMTAVGCLMFIAFTVPLFMAVIFGKWGFWIGVIMGLVILLTGFKQVNG
ncbi:MAG TPA: hypothetical protein GX504_02130 [Clostridia bacterium]|nr:hypothetical protein [Clostridia bacterium]